MFVIVYHISRFHVNKIELSCVFIFFGTQLFVSICCFFTTFQGFMFHAFGRHFFCFIFFETKTLLLCYCCYVNLISIRRRGNGSKNLNPVNQSRRDYEARQAHEREHLEAQQECGEDMLMNKKGEEKLNKNFKAK